jgi:DNA-binding transcriptional ArsR family regulator
MSAPAISRHLRVLRTSGLVSSQPVDQDGRGRVYHLRPERLTALQTWLEQVQSFWDEQLAAYRAHAEAAREGELP